MKVDRRQARILAMQFLCQLEVQGDEAMTQLDAFLAEAGVEGGVGDYARRLLTDVRQRQDQLDARLSPRLEHWDLARLTCVERNTMRVALAELEAGTIPPLVVISEAIEIGKEFGGADSSRFINGVLDATWKSGHASSGPPE